MAWPFRRVMRAVWSVLVALVVVVAFPILIWLFHEKDYSEDWEAWFYAGIFVFLTLPVTFYEVAMHLEYYTRPDLQIHVIRIHWMVPFYSLDSWLALAFLNARIYIDPLRECYEAYVIYSFFTYLGVFLNSELGDLEQFLALQPTVKHMWGFQYLLKNWQMGPQFVWECKKGVLNYVILRPITAVMSMVATALHFNKEGHVWPDGMWFWTGLINSFSQLWAIYCLVMFYRATKYELRPIKPIAKFLLIKSIVFLTYWQSIIVSMAIQFGWIKTKSWTTYQEKEDLGAGLQEFIICIEMFVGAIVFAYVFPPKDYMDPTMHSDGFFRNLMKMFDVRDVMRDVTDVVEADMSATRLKVADIASHFVHMAASFFKNPREFFKRHRWRTQKKTAKFDHLDSQAPLLKLYAGVDWSLSLPPALEKAICDEALQNQAGNSYVRASPIPEQSSESIGGAVQWREISDG